MVTVLTLQSLDERFWEGVERILQFGEDGNRREGYRRGEFLFRDEGVVLSSVQDDWLEIQPTKNDTTVTKTGVSAHKQLKQTSIM